MGGSSCHTYYNYCSRLIIRVSRARPTRHISELFLPQQGIASMFFSGAGRKPISASPVLFLANEVWIMWLHAVFKFKEWIAIAKDRPKWRQQTHSKPKPPDA